jgi:signal transduction histidine kinase
LLSLLSKQPAYYELRLVQANGQEKLHLIRGEIATGNDPVNRSNDPLIQSVIKTNQVGYSEVHFSEAARDRLVTIAVPMQDLFTGNVGSVLIAEVRFSNVEAALLEDFTFAQGEDVYVTDRNGVVIAHRNPSYVLKETVINLPDTDKRYPGLTNKDSFIDTDTVTLGNLELKVVAEISYEKATALATESTQISIIITVITLFVAGFIVAFAVTRVVNPIVQLSHVANAIQAGDFSQRSTIQRNDEIGQFAAAFNAMSDAIQKREEDLKQQANELRIATAKARESARVKSEFLANVSHELRTPLNAIIGFSDMLLMGMTGELNDKQRHKIERLLENGNRLLTLINHILDLTRIEARRIEIVNKPFSPAALVDRVANQMQVLADKNNLELSTNVDSTLPQVLMGDEQRIEQVIVNLLSNAFKFTEKGKVDLEIMQNLDKSMAVLQEHSRGVDWGWRLHVIWSA